MVALLTYHLHVREWTLPHPVPEADGVSKPGGGALTVYTAIFVLLVRKDFSGNGSRAKAARWENP